MTVVQQQAPGPALVDLNSPVNAAYIQEQVRLAMASEREAVAGLGFQKRERTKRQPKDEVCH